MTLVKFFLLNTHKIDNSKAFFSIFWFKAWKSTSTKLFNDTTLKTRLLVPKTNVSHNQCLNQHKLCELPHFLISFRTNHGTNLQRPSISTSAEKKKDQYLFTLLSFDIRIMSKTRHLHILSFFILTDCHIWHLVIFICEYGEVFFPSSA